MAFLKAATRAIISASASGPFTNMPTRRICWSCRADTANGQPAALPRSTMNSRRRIAAPESSDTGHRSGLNVQWERPHPMSALGPKRTHCQISSEKWFDALFGEMLADPDFVPFQPPERPLGLLGLPTLLRNYVETIPRFAYQQGVTRIRTRLSDVLVVSDPDIIKEILVEKAESFGRDPATRRSFSPVIGETSLFLAEGAHWRWQRRAVAPIFRHETLLSFVPIFATMAQRQLERCTAEQRAVSLDAAAAMTRTTFEIIVEAMLGGSASLDADRYSRALTDNFDTIPWHIVYVMFSIPEWMPYPHRRRAMRSRDFLHRDIRRIIESRRSLQSERPDLLNLLLAARDQETGRSM